jgi:DNA-binding LacI/PurR family transcriptional regulator
MPQVGPGSLHSLTVKPTLADVAKVAGVSHQTVSRVVNNSPRVLAPTRQRVMEAMEQLGYQPNTAARALATGQARTIGVVCYDTILYGPAATLLGIEELAREEGYSVLITGIRRLDKTLLLDAVQNLIRQAVAAIVVLAPQETIGKVLRQLPTTLPIVAVWGPSRSGVSVVTVDEIAGARAATDHLLTLGHEEIWHVTGPAGRTGSTRRLEGWKAAMTAAGKPPPEPLLGDWSARSGYEAGLRLAESRIVTAAFVANDQMALGVLSALAERGRRVPQDISVVGFDDIPEAAFLYPSLTTVRQDFHRLGRSGADLALNLVRDPQSQPASVVLPVELVVRGSSGPRR